MKIRGLKFDFSFPVKLDYKASAFTLCFAFIYIIAEIIYKVKFEKISCTWEIILLFLILFSYGFLRKIFDKQELPTDCNLNPLPNGYSKQDKRIRAEFYKKSALIYSAIFSVIIFIAFSCSSILSNVNIYSQIFGDFNLPNIILAVIVALISLPIAYIFSYMIEYLWYEYKISVYNEELEIKREIEERHKAILLKLKEEAKAEKVAAEPIKKRGRPRKAASSESVVKSVEEVPAAPKRRGRPPKKKPEEVEV